MRKVFLTLVALILFVSQSAQAQPSPRWVRNLPAARDSTQMVVVAGIRDTTAWVSMHEKIGGQWQMIMSTPGFVGYSGLGKVREYDNKTPSGTFRFDVAFGIAPDPGCAIPYVQLNKNHYWSGDNNYRYNQLVDASKAPANFDRYASEHLIDYDTRYIYALNIGYNPSNTTGKGFALFMQCFDESKPWTSGSVALPEEKMLFIIQHIKPNCACVIGTLENLGASL